MNGEQEKGVKSYSSEPRQVVDVPPATDENKSTKTWSAWGGEGDDLPKEKDQEPFPQWAFIGFNLHRNTGKAHQSLPGSEDQTIDNKQRTLRAYSELQPIS